MNWITCSSEKHALDWKTVIQGRSCPRCLESIVPIPEAACPTCFSLDCGPACRFSNILSAPLQLASFQTFHPLYLHHSGSGAFFKRWKKSGHLQTLESLFRDAPPPALHRIRMLPVDVIFPVPQSLARIFRLKRSTSLEVAKIIQRHAHPRRPVLCAQSEPRLQQRENSGYDRFTRERLKIKTLPEKEIRGASILIIDDFLTTGSTVLEFAELLSRFGARELHLVTLAVRVRRNERILSREEPVQLSAERLESASA